MLSIGGSGTGKTVLLVRSPARLPQPGKGRVTTLGRPAAELCRAGASARVGMLFQHGALYSAFSVPTTSPSPCASKAACPTPWCAAAMIKLQMVGLKPEHASRNPADLSGGMIKVALARALIMDPPRRRWMNPPPGLDPTSSDEFCALLRQLQADSTRSWSPTIWTRCRPCPAAWPCWPKSACWSAARRRKWCAA